MRLTDTRAPSPSLAHTAVGLALIPTTLRSCSATTAPATSTPSRSNGESHDGDETLRLSLRGRRGTGRRVCSRKGGRDACRRAEGLPRPDPQAGTLRRRLERRGGYGELPGADSRPPAKAPWRRSPHPALHRNEWRRHLRPLAGVEMGMGTGIFSRNLPAASQRTGV